MCYLTLKHSVYVSDCSTTLSQQLMLFFVSFPQSTLEVKIPVSGCVVIEASQKNLSNAFQARNCTRMHAFIQSYTDGVLGYVWV